MITNYNYAVPDVLIIEISQYDFRLIRYIFAVISKNKSVLGPANFIINEVLIVHTILCDHTFNHTMDIRYTWICSQVKLT